MVKSQITSITPAIHANRHASGGADPLMILPTSKYVIIDDTQYAVDGIGAGYVKIVDETLVLSHTSFLSVQFKSQKIGTDHFHARVYKNGVAVGTDRNCTVIDGWHTWDENLEFANGDTIEVWCQSVDVTHAGDLKEVRVIIGDVITALSV